MEWCNRYQGFWHRSLEEAQAAPKPTQAQLQQKPMNEQKGVEETTSVTSS